jgi:hypothetical protein
MLTYLLIQAAKAALCVLMAVVLVILIQGEP